jgi:hypothetical protein
LNHQGWARLARPDVGVGEIDDDHVASLDHGR